MPNQNRNWKKIVSESNGRQMFVPDEFVERTKKIEEDRTAYNKEVVRIAAKEIALNMETQNLFFDLRKYLEESGNEDIWVKDIGFESEALKDGVFVINITEGRQR